MKINWDMMNFIIATLALIIALYSIYYTKKLNRRKVLITGNNLYHDNGDPPIAWFEIHNLSSQPLTIKDIYFSYNENVIEPLIDYEPRQTHSDGLFHTPLSDFIPDYKYSEHLTAPQILQPNTSLELGYYFDKPFDSLTITITCAERIHHFKRHQSFVVHFSYVQE